jgi:sugar lactone lactonase YvrE
MKQKKYRKFSKYATIIVLLFSFNSLTAQLVTTAAGNFAKSSGYGGDGTNALNLHVIPGGLVNDASGNILFINGNAIRKLNTGSGILTTIAGSSEAGYLGDGANAALARLSAPSALAIDATASVLYIAEQGNNCIRKILLSNNVITTIAGNGTAGFSGDGGLAAAATLNNPSGLALDAANNLYISDKGNQRIRKIAAVSSVISTIAGDGTAGFLGDGSLATGARLNNPVGIAVDGSGILYCADRSNNRIRKIAANGIISTVAGNGTNTYSGDGAAATLAGIRTPNNVILNASNPTAFFISDFNGRIRRVDIATGNIITYAGTGVRGFSGDGGLPINASISFNATGGIANTLSLDASGNLYFADGSSRIRKINAANTEIETLAGNGNYSGDGDAALNAQLKGPGGIAIDNSGNIFIADFGNHRVRKVVKATGNIETYVGTGNAGYSGDSGLASLATLRNPISLAIDNQGNLLIADQGNNVIRSVDAATKNITTIAGTGVAGFSGDNGDATLAKLYYPSAITLDENNNLFIADFVNYRIRKVSGINGKISTIAGNGTSGYSGDNGVATSAKISAVTGIAYYNGNVYIADQGNNVIRQIDNSNIISNYAGNGTSGYDGDGGDAISAQFSSPSGLTVDTEGNLYIADADNDVIRKVSVASGIITTIAGTGATGYSGDGGQATAANFNYPYQLAFSGTKQLYITDRNNNVIRSLVSDIPFPVKLTRFDAVLKDQNLVSITWTTSQEINSNKFLVQRSLNGVNFEVFAEVKAKSNTNFTSNYEVLDESVIKLKPSTVYYRLLQLDNNGQSQLSEIRKVDFSNQDEIFRIYPNPVSDLLFISSSKLVQLNLYDIGGKLIKKLNSQQRRVDVSDIKNGVYFLVTVSANGYRKATKIVVQH